MSTMRRAGGWLVACLVPVTMVAGCSSDTDSPDPTPASQAGVDPSSAPQGSGQGSGEGSGEGSADAGPNSDAGGDGAGDSPGAGAATGDDHAGTASAAQATVLDRLPGPARGCAPVAGQRDVRSGDFGAGPFDEARSTFQAQTSAGTPATVRLYFIPAGGADRTPGLTVTVRNTETGVQRTVRQRETSDADRWTFYDTQVPISEPGRYRLQARSGSDVGCFVVDFG